MQPLNLTALFLDSADGQRMAEVNGLPRLGALLSSAQLRQLARQLNEIANDADQGASGEHCYTAPPFGGKNLMSTQKIRIDQITSTNTSAQDESITVGSQEKSSIPSQAEGQQGERPEATCAMQDEQLEHERLAETERAEVVATLFTLKDKVRDDGQFKPFCVAMDFDASGGDLYDTHKLITLVQHERIVRERHSALLNMLDRCIASRTRAYEKRDAAFARIAELEEQLIAAPAAMPHFAKKVLSKLRRFYDCASDFESGGVDIGRHWLDLLTQLGLLNRVQRSPALWEISQQGEDLLEGQSAMPAQAQHSAPQAWLDVQAERRRQIEAEGWTPEHDDAHGHGQMARAAACYALSGSSAPDDGIAALLVSLAWPWDREWWKPTTARRDLVKATALGLAAIECIDRAGISQNPQPGATTASSWGPSRLGR